ncbi:MAG: HisA/HisF-related TIM barrel protein [Legionella sp.]|nr:HisA/HisF-related TIM barrel protein [Legionella sp.]
MLRKRLIGVVTIRNNWAVQSFGYNHYLPLGKPECVVENLDRWGVDEILIQVIDRSISHRGPDLALMDKIANQGISTPLTYCGGISSETDAVNVIRAGADRICIDTLLHTDALAVRHIASRLGAQAIIASLPLAIDNDGVLSWYNYQIKQQAPISNDVVSLINEGVISEALLIDYQHEGMPDAYDLRLRDNFFSKSLPLILFGGLSSGEQIEEALHDSRVSAVAVGNFLNYQEHAVQKLKSKLALIPVRPPFYYEPS